MTLVSDHKPLHELYSPGSRKNHFPYADYRFLVRTTLNIAKAVASVHKLGCVIGDINHSSILVSKVATVALIDSDSFQVPADAQVFLCRVGVPEYTPPELQGLPLGSVTRTSNHDAFGLAVVIFQLLFMGRHPFIGTVRRGELPPLPDAIRDSRFVYAESRDVGMDQPPGTPALSDFPRAVGAAFEAAFGPAAKEGRPSAASWVGCLSELEQSLVQCSEDKLHWYPNDASDCLWCVMERELGTTLFVPYIPPARTTIHPFDPGAGGFNLAEVWRHIEAFSLPDRPQLLPNFGVPPVGPSTTLRTYAAHKKVILWSRGVAGAAAGLMAVYIPGAWIVWLPLAGYALFGKARDAPVTVDNLKRQYVEIEGRWPNALATWHKKIGLDEIDKQVELLREARVAYERLPTEERAQREHYKSERRKRQLHAYLDAFEIRYAKVKGIGPAKQAALASYGIETAGDVEYERVLGVPGFGPATSTGLVQWQRWIESRFVYNELHNEVDRQELARINSNIQTKASDLRRILLAGRSNLELLASRTKAMIEVREPELLRLNTIMEQLRTDIRCLGGVVPSASLQQRVTVSPPPHLSTSVTAPARQGGATTGVMGSSGRSCPRCGSTMIQRVARRGRWAGHPFWGCSRYPVCKGTRNS